MSKGHRCSLEFAGLSPAPMRPWYCKPFKSNRDWLAKYPISSAPRKSINTYGAQPDCAPWPDLTPRFGSNVSREDIDRCIEERRAYEIACMLGRVIEPPLPAAM